MNGGYGAIALFSRSDMLLTNKHERGRQLFRVSCLPACLLLSLLFFSLCLVCEFSFGSPYYIDPPMRETVVIKTKFILSIVINLYLKLCVPEVPERNEILLDKRPVPSQTD
jgi:hypothetical protein